MAYIAEMLPVCCCYTTDYSNAACLLLVDRYLPSGDPAENNVQLAGIGSKDNRIGHENLTLTFSFNYV